MLCGDKAYLSRKICDLIAKHGGRWAVHLDQEECRQDQSAGLEGKEGDDARDVPPEQEALQETVPSKEPRRNGGLYSQEEVQPHALFEEKKGTEERTQAEGNHVQPLDHSKAPAKVRLDSTTPDKRQMTDRGAAAASSPEESPHPPPWKETKRGGRKYNQDRRNRPERNADRPKKQTINIARFCSGVRCQS